MAYTTINKSTLHFNTLTWTGTGSSNARTGLGFQPDWVWLKNRGATSNHHVVDVVRGITKELRANLNNTEATDDQLITAFGTDGFTLGTSGSGNTNGNTYVGWSWKAGNSAGSVNTDGTLNSTVSVNTTAGFSVVTYTGNGSAGATVGHGLGAVPKMIIEKGRSVTDDWLIYHHKIGNTHGLAFNNTTAATDSDSYFNDTTPTSSVFTIGNNGKVNTNNGTHVAYCFAEKKGFSKFGSYVGNGSTDGTYVHTGFKPAFVMVKRTNSTSNWGMYDSGRDVDNVVAHGINANTTAADDISDFMDFYSNGFKHRSASANRNGNGDTYIYMSFAEEPVVGSNNIPATAR